ncbi:MAG: DUF4922 domain-containing protein [Tannerellaceae bacterium]|nr:DUF4922 domain-containing protein [Tannerellaceae bacterium]
MPTTPWSDTAAALALLKRQQKAWPAAHAGYEALEEISVRSLRVGDLTVRVQYNPARILSSGAATDASSILRRPCFLCPDRRPKEQEALSMGPDYELLCNPYPIFPQHFIIASRRHEPQRIGDRIDDFLETARCLEGLTLFYNGPHCGASAPDHLHFQAVTSHYMPLDSEAALHQSPPIWQGDTGEICLLNNYLRNGFILSSDTAEGAISLFRHVYNALPLVNNEPEPRMNLFSRYDGGRRQLILIPRRLHRPRQYYAPGAERLLTSPGAADIGGVFITALASDYERITPFLLRDIYAQVSFPADVLKDFFNSY